MLRLTNPYLGFLAYISNDGYKRVKSLEKFAGGDFRQDIISNNLGNWITSGSLSTPWTQVTNKSLEYKKAFAAIGNASTDDVCYQFGRSSPLLEISRDFLSDIPSVSTPLIVRTFSILQTQVLLHCHDDQSPSIFIHCVSRHPAIFKTILIPLHERISLSNRRYS